MLFGLKTVAAHLLALTALATPLSAPADHRAPPPIKPELLRPVALDYKASKFFITAETSVALATRPTAEVNDQLKHIEGLQGIMPDQDQVIVETLRTSVLGRDTTIDVLMNPNTRILQTNSLKSGHKDRYRLYRHFTDQVYSIKRFPKDSNEQKAGWQNWSDIQEDFYPTPEANRSLVVTEAEGLFYLISVLDWSKVTPQHAIILFDVDGLIELTMDFVGDTTLKVDYQEINAQGAATRVKGAVPVKQIRIDGRPLDPNANMSDFNFMNYKGAVNLFVDPYKQIVLEMSGDLEYVGEVAVKLQSANFHRP